MVAVSASTALTAGPSPGRTTARSSTRTRRHDSGRSLAEPASRRATAGSRQCPEPERWCARRRTGGHRGRRFLGHGVRRQGRRAECQLLPAVGLGGRNRLQRRPGRSSRPSEPSRLRWWSSRSSVATTRTLRLRTPSACVGPTVGGALSRHGRVLGHLRRQPCRQQRARRAVRPRRCAQGGSRQLGCGRTDHQWRPNGIQALKAQAVAARSYGVSQNRNYPVGPSGGPSYASTCDSTSCQVYGGAARRPNGASPEFTVLENGLTNQAIAQTPGEVRRRSPGGPLVSTEFSSSNGPRTAGGTFPAIDDPFDATPSNKLHRWTRVLDANTLAAKYGLGTLLSASMIDVANGYDGIWYNDVVLTRHGRYQADPCLDVPQRPGTSVARFHAAHRDQRRSPDGRQPAHRAAGGRRPGDGTRRQHERGTGRRFGRRTEHDCRRPGRAGVHDRVAV